jgi:hypothetical protein
MVRRYRYHVPEIHDEAIGDLNRGRGDAIHLLNATKHLVIARHRVFREHLRQLALSDREDELEVTLCPQPERLQQTILTEHLRLEHKCSGRNPRRCRRLLSAQYKRRPNDSRRWSAHIFLQSGSILMVHRPAEPD